MNISAMSGGVAGGGLLRRNAGLKSTQEKQERQQKMRSQVDFYENQKANLGKMKFDTVEEIARKLDLLHTYEDEIAAAKAAYNQEQMFHVLDEARERGGQIAEAAEQMEHKTPEERRKEAADEAAKDSGDGLLEELLEESVETPEELSEEPELPEGSEAGEHATAKASEKQAEENDLADVRLDEKLINQKRQEREDQRRAIDEWRRTGAMAAYRPFDIRG